MLATFAHPERLWLLSALVPMAAWAARGARRRSLDWEALGQSGGPVGDGSTGWLVAWALLVLALAQPRWGRIAGAESPEGHDVVFLVDASRSMAAEDAVPDRMGLAIASASGLLRALGEESGPRASVVAFAGRGVVRCPLTSNLEAAAESLAALRPGEVQPGGTDLAAGLAVALDAFDTEGRTEGRTIVVFSDGEDHAGTWSRAVDRLRAEGVIVHGVAIGDPDRAHPVPPADRAASKGRHDPPDETRRSDAALEALARSTGGAFIPLGVATADLGALYRDRIAPTARRRRADLRPPERVERFPAFVLGAMGVGLAGSWPGLSRRRARRLALGIAALGLPAIGAGAGAGSPAGLVAEGGSAYASGRFAEALEAFERAVALDPSAAVPRYDAAAALFQLGRHAEAIARYEEARERGGPGLATRIDFGLGNAHLALGDIPGAIAAYDACLGSTGTGRDLDAVRRDAAANRAFAVSKLQAPPVPPDREGDDSKAPRRTRPDAKTKSSGRGAGQDSAKAPPGRSGDGRGGEPPSASEAGNPGDPGEPTPSESPPETRLDAALREIREARRHRAPESPPAPSSRPSKDW